MPTFLVEAYAAGSAAVVEEARARARRTAEVGDSVRYVRTTFLPGDETVMHLFEAPSAETLIRAGRLAELSFERVVEAVDGGAADKETR